MLEGRIYRKLIPRPREDCTNLLSALFKLHHTEHDAYFIMCPLAQALAKPVLHMTTSNYNGITRWLPRNYFEPKASIVMSNNSKLTGQCNVMLTNSLHIVLHKVLHHTNNYVGLFNKYICNEYTPFQLFVSDCPNVAKFSDIFKKAMKSTNIFWNKIF